MTVSIAIGFLFIMSILLSLTLTQKRKRENGKTSIRRSVKKVCILWVYGIYAFVVIPLIIYLSMNAQSSEVLMILAKANVFLINGSSLINCFDILFANILIALCVTALTMLLCCSGPIEYSFSADDDKDVVRFSGGSEDLSGTNGRVFLLFGSLRY